MRSQNKSKVKARAIAAEEFLSPGAFYAATTLVLAALCALVAGLGFLGIIDYPAAPDVSSHFSLFCTTFGGGFAAVFAASSFVFSRRADQQLKTRHMLNLSLRKSCLITQDGHTMRVLTTSFCMRHDLLPTLSKQQKLDCLQPGQWTMHKQEGERQVLAKFDFENTLGFRKHCSVSLKIFPLNEEKKTKNIMYDKEGALFLSREGEILPFRGDVANSYLVQKMWIFCQKHFKQLMVS